MKVPENETSWEAIESVIILPTAASLLFWWEVELYLWNGGIPALYLFGLWAQNFCQSLHEQGNLSVLSECSCVCVWETVEAVRIFCHGSHPGGDRSDAFYLGFWVTGVADTDLKCAPWW